MNDAYYNEIDAYCAEWDRDLIQANLIAPGVVDERDIRDVYSAHLRRYTQCHFFAGIGIWSAALRAAGWSDDRPVWTGSCPCQPFSGAGKRGGFADERHLWPAWFWHICHEKPNTIFGEQVAGADDWIDLVRNDLEGIGYAFGCVEIPSAGFGAANIRARNYWVAHRVGIRNGMGTHSDSAGLLQSLQTAGPSDFSKLADANSNSTRRDAGTVLGEEAQSGGERFNDGDYVERPWDGGEHGGAYPPDRLWPGGDRVEWVLCRDPKGSVWRPIEPGALPLAPSDSSTVGRLRAYGNAINLKTATEFIRAFMDVIGG